MAYRFGMTKASRFITRFFGVVLLLLAFCGCVRTVTKDDLNDLGMEHAAAGSLDQTYYVGSKGNYDYFTIRNGSGEVGRRYRVRKLEEAVTDRFSRTTNQTEWRAYGSELVVTNGGAVTR